MMTRYQVMKNPFNDLYSIIWQLCQFNVYSVAFLLIQSVVHYWVETPPGIVYYNFHEFNCFYYMLGDRIAEAVQQ